MSATLVGSEMCIRDRASGAGTRGCRLQPQDPWQRERDKLEGIEEDAVSYTHLTLPTICSV
eukprot:4611738-Alexandrium_andersonii.AAC.1